MSNPQTQPSHSILDPHADDQAIRLHDLRKNLTAKIMAATPRYQTCDSAWHDEAHSYTSTCYTCGNHWQQGPGLVQYGDRHVTLDYMDAQILLDALPAPNQHPSLVPGQTCPECGVKVFSTKLRTPGTKLFHLGKSA